MKRFGFFLLVGIMFISASTDLAQASSQLSAIKVDKAPVIDGTDSDAVWRNARPVVTHDPIAGIEVSLQAVYTDTHIFFLVHFPDPDESRLHKPWIWQADKQLYEMGPEREDCFVLKWAMNSRTSDLSVKADQTYMADVWFWKAHRTDPAGCADDKYQRLLDSKLAKTMPVTSRSGATFFLERKGDQGRPAYQSTLPVAHTEDKLAQFTHRASSGSRADIRAKGVWSDGRWCVEFARALDTGHEDDIQFKLDRSYLFGVSRYEIAGRKPDARLSQPLYGSGDVSEMLTLVFEK